jgi:hypothetical protein
MPKIKGHFRRLAGWMVVIALSTYQPKIAHADSSTANISVTVSDSSGAFIPGAHLVLRNSDTNQEQRADSGKAGSADFFFLKPGHYALTVSKAAFADVFVDNIVLNVGDDRRLQLSLKVGSAAQTVNVDGSGLSVNTTDASVSTVVDRRFVENLPLNGRSFQDLISMTPGVATQSPQSSQATGAKGDFSVNGQRTESNYYTVDGVSANISAGAANGGPQAATGGGVGATTALGTTQSLISVDALQEFRVLSSTYSAEYGRSPGGQFTLATRSGTSSFHGSLYNYLRNSYFDANNWFNNHYGKPISPLRQNDFGGTLGGPVHLTEFASGDRALFFFGSYEGLRLTQPQAASIQYVPDAALRQNAPAALKPVLSAFPVQTPGGIDYASGLAQFIQPFSLPSQIDSGSIRFDQTVSSLLALFFRFSDTPSFTTSRTLASLTKTSFNTQTYTLGATSQLSARLTNEFRLGYSRSDSTGHTTIDSFGGASPTSLAASLGNYTSGNPYSAFQIVFPGTGSSGLQEGDNFNQGRQWNLVDTANLNAGKHQVKFGIDYRRIKSPLHPASPYVEGIALSQSDVINNSASIAILAKILAATPIFNETAAFVQDEWHVASRLVLSGGLRSELNPPPTDQHGNDAFTVLGNINNPATLTLAPRGTPLWKTSWYNFAPRMGLAYTARSAPDWETVIRTGGGVFFDTGNQIAATGFQYLGFSAIQTQFGFSFPITPAQLAFSPSVTAPYTSSDVVAFPEHLQLPYTLEWNASVQQALGKPQSLTISYVGSNGRRLLQLLELSVNALNPNFSGIEVPQTGVTSNYQALQVQFQRSVAHGIQALASYTWSHAIDYGSNDSALPSTRGNSDFDVRNSLQAGMSWDLPSAYHNASTRMLLENWGLDGRLTARTAFPVTLQGNYLTDPATGNSYYGNVSVVPGQPLYLYGSQYPGGRSINAAAFQLPASGDGNAPRNFVRGFGETQVNLAARRSFPLGKEATLNFRVEAFNLLNHPIFGLIDSTLTDLTFGQATQTLNQSLSTMSSQYQQGGPRSLQFALKIQF